MRIIEVVLEVAALFVLCKVAQCLNCYDCFYTENDVSYSGFRSCQKGRLPEEALVETCDAGSLPRGCIKVEVNGTLHELPGRGIFRTCLVSPIGREDGCLVRPLEEWTRLSGHDSLARVVAMKASEFSYDSVVSACYCTTNKCNGDVERDQTGGATSTSISTSLRVFASLIIIFNKQL